MQTKGVELRRRCGKKNITNLKRSFPQLHNMIKAARPALEALHLQPCTVDSMLQYDERLAAIQSTYAHQLHTWVHCDSFKTLVMCFYFSFTQSLQHNTVNYTHFRQMFLSKHWDWEQFFIVGGSVLSLVRERQIIMRDPIFIQVFYGFLAFFS